ncbi:unnamed protein product [Effrenium voratum]|nr:unnamed protein product [Effrenium voratum]
MAQKRPAARARAAHGVAGIAGIEVRCAGGAVKPRLTRAEAAPGQWRRARRLLREEGVVVLRQLLPKSSVQRARSRLLAVLREAGATTGAGTQLAPECLAGEVPAPSLLRRLDVQALPEVRNVLEHRALFDATARLLEVQEVVTTAYKWLRAVPPEAFTGPHMDRAYVGASQRRLTAWVPLGPVRCGQNELGALCWVPGSHKEPAVVERFRDYQSAGSDGERLRRAFPEGPQQPTHSDKWLWAKGVPKDLEKVRQKGGPPPKTVPKPGNFFARARSGWLAPDPGALQLPPGCEWSSAHFAAGDVAAGGSALGDA